MDRVITVYAFGKALVEAGVMTEEQLNRTTHFVIDCNPRNGSVNLYTESLAGQNLLNVVLGLNGIEIQGVEPVHRLLTDEEIRGIISRYTDPQLVEAYRIAHTPGEPISAWAQLLVDEVEKRGEPAAILKRKQADE